MTIRTSVASINTATANVNPIILTTRKSPKVNAANTTIMIAAALVIRPAVLATPSGIASKSLSPLLLASRTRAAKNTSLVLRTKWLRREEVMKTAESENQIRCTCFAATREHGTEDQNNPAQRARLDGKENFLPREKCFFLDSLYGTIIARRRA